MPDAGSSLSSGTKNARSMKVSGLKTIKRVQANERQRMKRATVPSISLMAPLMAPRPLVKPKPIHTSRAEKVNWGDPGMRAQLADAYKRAGGDDEKAARIFGVSVGSARLAKR
jgi:hypothetical protein